MIATVTLLFAVTTLDPRPDLLELQLEGKTREALAATQRELAERPVPARRMGLDYLQGHLYDKLDDPPLASEAFGAAMASIPELALYSRYRMALAQEEMRHPEVAAGLVASVVAAAPSPALTTEAVRLLARSLAAGGDCRLLGGLKLEKLSAADRRTLLLAQADCSLRAGTRELSRDLLIALLEENRDDETGRAAAERLAGLVSESERGRTPMLLGLTFFQHREWDRALVHLQRALGNGSVLSEPDAHNARYAQARSHFWQERYAPAATLFANLAQRARSPRERARALYQQGRSYELLGHWNPAVTSFKKTYMAEPQGEWSASALVSALRLHWRAGQEAPALQLFGLLVSRREWRDNAFRAALFLASSDIVRGRGNRAGAWLDRVLPGTADDRLELAYWRGRLAELRKELSGAAVSYAEAVRIDPYHPLSRVALDRLGKEPLARTAASEGRRLTASNRPEDLYAAWILLGYSEESAAGQAVRNKLRQILLAERSAAPFLRLSEVPVERWPIWSKDLKAPEEILLSLGILHEGAPAVRQHFPASDPSLALTGSLILAQAGEHERSILQAEAVRIRTPARVPLALQPRLFHNLLYPLPYRDAITSQGRLRGIDPHLLAAIILEESRFDRYALSPAAARGLTQFTIPTASRIAAQIGIGRLNPEDLYRPEIATALGAAYLAMLQKASGGLDYMAVAAYNAGEPQAALWRSYCFSPELDEYFTKVGFKETRGYLRRVLTSRAHYAELY
ncbi:MAG TPA: lytic transglycosylase domain-containing protein [Thermoanaerobaculia bacterium]